MIAEVYPLIRLPRRFDFFDYAISDKSHIDTGDLVEMKFKGRLIFGIVKGTKTSSEFKKIIPIENLIKKSFLSKDDIHRYEQISKTVIQSTSSILSAAFQGLRYFDKTSVEYISGLKKINANKTDVNSIKHTLESMKKSNNMNMSMSYEASLILTQILREKRENQILIIAPRERDAEFSARLIDLGKCAIIHGKTKPKQRNAIIRAWQSGSLKTLVGTRQAALLPAKKIDTIIILDAGSDDYLKLNRNPRVNTLYCANLLANQHDAKLIHTSPFALLQKRSDLEEVRPRLGLTLRVVDLGGEEEKTGLPLISETLKESIEKSLKQNKKSLLVYNKKGVAKRLQCRACDYIPVCGKCQGVPTVREKDLVCPICKTEMWIPTNCPSCRLPKLTQKGIGNKRLKTILEKSFPGKRISIIDASTKKPEPADIYLVTEKFFKQYYKPFSKRAFGTIADLMIDLGLQGESFRSNYQTAYKLHRLCFFAAQQQAECIVQTWLPEIVRPMLNTNSFLAQELEIRKLYELPPFFEHIMTIDKDEKITYKQRPENLYNLDDRVIIEVDTDYLL
jgi:primosomal protein N'